MARFLLALFVLLMAIPAQAQPKMPAVPAIEVTKEKLAEIEIVKKPVYAVPERVQVGAHVNDVLEVDLRNHSYRLDLYVWFRWHNPDFKPWETAEFMNAFDPADHVRTVLYDEPQEMPDGSLYMVIRQQGMFSTKFPLQQYPFDQQKLVAAMEDSVSDTTELVYLADRSENAPLTLGRDVSLPGFNVGAPVLNIISFAYPTRFGDISDKEGANYARANFIVPVTRPWLAMSTKIFLPVILIVFCASLVFFVHPSYVEGRLSVVITALLTLVALQLTTANSLPDVAYLLLTDKIYILCYLFIIAALMQVVRSSAKVHAGALDGVQRADRQMLWGLLCMMLAGVAVIWVGTFL